MVGYSDCKSTFTASKSKFIGDTMSVFFAFFKLELVTEFMSPPNVECFITCFKDIKSNCIVTAGISEVVHALKLYFSVNSKE